MSSQNVSKGFETKILKVTFSGYWKELSQRINSILLIQKRQLHLYFSKLLFLLVKENIKGIISHHKNLPE